MLFLLLFMVVSLALRIALCIRSLGAIDVDASLLRAFAWGTVFDLATALLVSLPAVLLLTVLPERLRGSVIFRAVAHVTLFAAIGVLLFSAVAEWTFWDEFHARFNFIAVDYLVYTTEVMNNIRESYPLGLILSGVGAAAALAYALLLRSGLVHVWLAAPATPWRRRYAVGGAWLALAVLGAVAFDQQRMLEQPNAYQREIAKNGVWSLFAAFRNNELDYTAFYPTVSDDEAFATMARELAADGGIPLGDNRHDTLRFIANPGTELRPNVIQITVESLSAEFLGVFNPQSNLTPNLDALARESLLFTNFYATGTRTDRGMEALSLALPPTPGRSLIKRPHNEDLFTLGSVFRSRDYDTAFLYGGFGYFDNMNAFFGGNGYRVIDRASARASDITFANAWGACDEDLFRWVVREADRDFTAGKPFHFFVMTTSNHRPYTYPEGRIDLPPKVSGREGAVKYTDYAIGELIRTARTRPWFKDTVFVIVADHCASVAGKAELPVHNYHIPLLVYSPGGHISPGRVDDLTSQVDFAPTLLGLLNWSYASRFFGWDVLRASGDRRALIGNYQKLGLYEPGMLGVLAPRRAYHQYAYDAEAKTLRQASPDQPDERTETIAYYQAASFMYRHRRYSALNPEQQRAASLSAEQRRVASGQ